MATSPKSTYFSPLSEFRPDPLTQAMRPGLRYNNFAREAYAMLTIQTKATVTPERLITLSVPAEVVPGEHQVILVIEAAPPPELAPRPPLDCPSKPL